METSRKRKLELEQQPPSGAAINVSHFDLTPIPVTDVSILNSTLEQILPQTKSDEVVEFYIPPNPVQWLALNGINLYLELAVQTAAGAKLPDTSLTSVGNLIHSTLFESFDLKIDGVTVTTGANLYSFASYINKKIFNPASDIKTRCVLEGMYIHNNESEISTSNAAYVSLKALAQKDHFETYGKLAHGIFSTQRYLPPGHSMSLRLRSAPNTFYLNGSGLAETATFTDRISIKNIYLQARKIVTHSKIDQQLNAALNSGKLLSIPYYDFQCTSFVIPQGMINYTSEVLMNSLPSFACLAFIPTTAFFGSYSKSPFMFKDHKLASFRLTLNNEEVGYSSTPRISVAGDEYYVYYKQLLNIKNDKGIESCGIGLDEYTKYGCFIVPLYNALPDKKDTFPLSSPGAVRVQLSFKESLTENINVILYW